MEKRHYYYGWMMMVKQTMSRKVNLTCIGNTSTFDTEGDE